MHELSFRKYGLPPLSSQFGTHLDGNPPISRSFSFFRRARASLIRPGTTFLHPRVYAEENRPAYLLRRLGWRLRK